MMRYQVEWIDSGTYHQDGWQDKDAILSACRIGRVISVGFLFAETDTTLYLALSYDPEHNTYMGVQAIQKSAIVKKVVLRER